MQDTYDAMRAFDQSRCTAPVEYIIGVDEAGRGSLAGPLVAAAVVLPQSVRLEGITDSKRLSPARREERAAAIKSAALAWGIGYVSAKEIDDRGLDWANRIVFTRAVRQLKQRMAQCTRANTLVLVDGVRPPYRCLFRYEMVKGGDSVSLAVAAASIVAKTERDRYCVEVMDTEYPEYGFAKHKGYATAEHYAAIARHGPSPIHRHSYALVRSS